MNDGSNSSARPAEDAALAVRRLVVTDFRSYATAKLDAEPRSVVFTGPNGAGKTNMLEAVSLLAPGQGLRRSRLTDLARVRGPGTWAISADVTGPFGLTKIGTGVQEIKDGRSRRIVRIDGDTVSGPAALADYVSAVWLTPQMDRLFIEGSSSRRRFLDRLVYGLDPEHAKRVTAYEKVTRERLKLLKNGISDAAWLSALEETMAEHAVAVAAARVHAVEALRGALAEAEGPFPKATIDLEGQMEAALADGEKALTVEDTFRETLARNRRRDGERGTTSAGPHKTDLLAEHTEKGMPAAVCSTGEQKALLISIVLADARLQAARRGMAPLLLLDEVVAHLDMVRRAALFEEIKALGAQAWLTGTDRSLFDALEGQAQFVSVTDGVLDF